MKPVKAPTPEESYDDEEAAHASAYDDESDPDEKEFNKTKTGKVAYQPKVSGSDAKNMIKEQNAKVVQNKKEIEPIDNPV